MHAWEIQPGEPSKWFVRFQHYLELGAKRSLLAVYRAEVEEESARSGGIQRDRAKSVPSSWRKASGDWHWEERAAAYEAQAAAGAQTKIETARSVRVERQIQAEDDWQARQIWLREKEWKVSQALYKKAEALLESFDIEANEYTTEDGETRQIVRWGLKDIATFMDLASALSRKASQMDEGASRQQLAAWFGLGKYLLEMDGDSSDLMRVKQAIASFLDGQLLSLGKPATPQMRQLMAAAQHPQD